jgi:hypothetical protein
MAQTSDEIMAAAQAALNRAQGVTSAPSLNDKLVKGAALGAVASIPFAGIGLVGGAVIGAGIAALDSLSKD